jgi:hypothetical protein
VTPTTLLDFEATHPEPVIRKEERIRSVLGISPARYVVLLRRVAASREGQAHDPITAHRVLRMHGEAPVR